MKVHQFYTKSELRNFTYVLELEKDLWVIDPWDADQVVEWIQPLGKKLSVIINTHEHWDHIRGNQKLVELFSAEVWAHEKAKSKIEPLHKTLHDGQVLELESSYQMKVLDTPGHTMAHLCFLITKNGKGLYLFTGDTLFNAGVGHCRMGGDPEILFETIQNQVLTMDDDILIYPGHDYLINNLGFTLSVEPQNQRARQVLDQYKKKSWKEGDWVSKLKDEKEINTFLRTQEGEFSFGKLSSSKQVFLKLRELRNHW